MIRQAKAGDVAAISRLWLEMVDFHSEIDPLLFRAAENGAERYAQSVSERLEDPWSRVLVADIDGEIGGYAFGMIADITTEMYQPTRCGFLADLCVSAALRRQGIGSRLVTEMARWFGASQVRHYEWHVSAGNAAALAFWNAIGGQTTILRMRAECGSD